MLRGYHASMKQMDFIRYSVPVFLWIAVAGAYWDVYLWHANLERESLWQLPHMVLFGGIILACISSLALWMQTRNPEWRASVISLILMPVAFFLDDTWHAAFGSEPIGSLIIFWSLPHIVIVATLLLTTVLQTAFLRRKSPMIVITSCFVVIFELLSFLLRPFRPTGNLALLGIFGAPAAIALCIFLLLIWQQKMRSRFAAVQCVCMLLIFHAVVFSIALLHFHVRGVEHDLWQRLFGGHMHQPVLLEDIAYLCGAFILDMFRSKSLMLRLIIAGAISGICLYVLGYSTIPSTLNNYSFASALFAVFLTVLTCIAAALIIRTSVFKKMHNYVPVPLLKLPSWMTGCICLLFILAWSIIFQQTHA